MKSSSMGLLLTIIDEKICDQCTYVVYRTCEAIMQFSTYYRVINNSCVFIDA